MHIYLCILYSPCMESFCQGTDYISKYKHTIEKYNTIGDLCLTISIHVSLHVWVWASLGWAPLCTFITFYFFGKRR